MRRVGLSQFVLGADDDDDDDKARAPPAREPTPPVEQPNAPPAPVEAATPPPPPLVETARAHAATRRARTCAICALVIRETVHEYVVRQCSHWVHAECARRLLLVGGMAACPVCPSADTPLADADTKQRVYALDAGADSHVRAACVDSLMADYVRGTIDARRRARARTCLTWRARADKAAPLAYTDVTRAPGGRAPAPRRSLLATVRARWRPDDADAADADAEPRGFECTSASCGGPDACVHRYVRAIDVRALADALECSASPAPFDATHVDEARAVVERLVRLHVAPATLERCGATAGVLGALGITLERLVVGERYELVDVLDTFVGGADDEAAAALRALGFTPALWLQRAHFPAVVFAERAGARALLRAYAPTYSTLVDGLRLRQEELVVLGLADAALLRALGATNEHVARAVAELDRVGRGAHWYWRAFAWTRALAATTRVAAPSSDAVRRGADAFARVYADECARAARRAPV